MYHSIRSLSASKGQYNEFEPTSLHTESAMVEVWHTFAAHQLSKFATTQNKTNYKKDFIYFDTIEQTRIARAKKRQLVKTVSRKGAKLTFFYGVAMCYCIPMGTDLYLHIMYPRDNTVDSQVTSYTRKRIAFLHKEGFYPVQILEALRRENLQGSLASVNRIIKKIQKTGSAENRPRSGRPTKLPADMKAFIEKQMRINDKATSIKIQKQLAKRGIFMNSSTVRRSRAKQGWTL